MSYEEILVLDIGTSGAKAAIFSSTGHLLAEAGACYETTSPRAGRFEQSPDDWVAAAELAISRLGDLRSVALLTLTGTMQNVIPLGRDGRPLLPAILYSDNRAISRFVRFNERMQACDAAAHVGNQIDSLMCSAKLDWLRAEAPQVLDSATMVHTGAKDYVAFHLTGKHATDATSASTTGLMDLQSREWDPVILEELSIAPHRLPSILPSEAILGPLSAGAASRLRLRAGLPVLNGVGDAGAATIGAGLERPNQTYAYVGTTGWVARVASSQYSRVQQPVFTLAHPDPKLLIEIAPILSACDSMTWFENICMPEQTVPENRDDHPPLYLPYLKGERSPFHDHLVRGAFLGLDRSHGPTNMRRAVMEGVALAIRHNIEALGEPVGALMVLGGGASNDAWMQILADITGHSAMIHPTPVSATAYGAAILGSRALDIKFDSLVPLAVFEPTTGAAEHSTRLFKRYVAASDFLRAWANI